MSGWYVSYRAGSGPVMSLARSRDEAISTACELVMPTSTRGEFILPEDEEA
jgi:hypothetical protein